MDDDDPFAVDCGLATSEILQCLRLLAEQTGRLPLPRTQLALHKAIRACTAERNQMDPALRVVRPKPRRHLILH